MSGQALRASVVQCYHRARFGPEPAFDNTRYKTEHCWVQGYLPGSDWFGIDASEAAKDPARRDYFYASQPGDRIHFSTGKDIVLSPEQRSGPLNYFIYPLVEVDGERFTGPVVTRFSYQTVEAVAVQ